MRGEESVEDWPKVNLKEGTEYDQSLLYGLLYAQIINVTNRNKDQIREFQGGDSLLNGLFDFILSKSFLHTGSEL